jgi:hypothetical protein
VTSTAPDLTDDIPLPNLNRDCLASIFKLVIWMVQIGIDDLAFIINLLRGVALLPFEANTDDR